MKLRYIFAILLIAALMVACEKPSTNPLPDDPQQEEPNDENKDDNKDENKDENKGDSGKKETLNVWAFTDEVPGMVDKYIELNPEFGEKYEI